MPAPKPPEPPKPKAKSDDLSLLPSTAPTTLGALELLAAEVSGQQPPAPPADSPALIAPPAPATPPPPVPPKTPATPAAPSGILPAEPIPPTLSAPAPVPPTPPPKDEFDAYELGPHRSPKAAEAFESVKRVAREKVAGALKTIQDHEATIAGLQQKITELSAQIGTLPDAVKTELDELRNFRVASDATSDPRYQNYLRQIESNRQAIYRQLLVAGLTKENIEEIKKLGGPEKVDWSPAAITLPTPTKNFVDAILAQNVLLRDSADQFLSQAREDGSQYLAARNEHEIGELTNEVNALLKGFSWTAVRDVPATLEGSAKAEAVADREFAQTIPARLKEMLATRSPKRIAEMAIGTLIAHRNQGIIARLQARLAEVTSGQVTSLETKVAELTKERDTLAAKLAGIKKAELPRPVASGIVPPAPSTPTVDTLGSNVPTRQALEGLADQYIRERQGA